MGWEDVGKTNMSSSSNLLVQLEGSKRLRLLPEVVKNGPKSWWNYAINTPNGDYRTWISPPRDQDFFAINRQVFRATPRHAGLAYDYDKSAILILEAGNQVWEAIKNFVEAGIDLTDRDIVITKNGEGRNTSYFVVYHDPTPLDLTGLERPDIDEFYKPPTKEEVLQDLRELGFTNPEELFTLKPLPEERAYKMEIPFGKYKGKTIEQVYREDSEYLFFLATRIDRIDVREAARVVCNKLLGTDYPLSGIAPTLDEVSYIPPVRDGRSPVISSGNSGEQQNKQQQSQEHLNIQPTNESSQEDQGKTSQDTQQPTPVSNAQVNRDALISEIHQIFETDPKYKDFMLIIDVMKKASAPHGKTSINEFTDQELLNLLQIIKQ